MGNLRAADSPVANLPASPPEAAADVGAAPPVGRAGRRVFVTALLLLCAFRVFLAGSLPSVHREWGVDDLLYVRTADHLARGEWLGPYDSQVLTKEIGYPVFLAAAHTLGVPKRLAEELLLCGSVLVLAWGLRRLGMGRVLTTTLAFCTLFSPATYTAQIWQIQRQQGVTNAQVLMIVGLATALLARATPARRALLAGVLGVVLAWFWHTREESIWILPCLAVFGLTLLVIERRRGARWPQALAMTALLAAIPAASVVGANALLRAQNERAYGAAVEIEMKDPDYVAACAALARVTAGDWHQYQPLTTPQKTRLAGLSPAFAELPGIVAEDAFQLEGSQGERSALTLNRVYWSMRDAANDAGWHKDLPTALRSYRRLADEINDVCDRRLIAAGPPRRTELPEIEPSLLHALADRWVSNFADMWHFRFSPCSEGPAPGPPATPASVALYRRILGEPEVPALDRFTALRFDCLGVLRVVFQNGSIWLMMAGAVGLLVQLVLLRRRGVGEWLAVEAAVFVAIASLGAVNAFLQTYWWPTWNLYLLPVYMLMPALAILAIAGALRAIGGLAWPTHVRASHPTLASALHATAAVGLLTAVVAGLIRAAAVERTSAIDGIPIAMYRPVDSGATPLQPILQLHDATLDGDVENAVAIRVASPDAWFGLRLPTAPAAPHWVDLVWEVTAPAVGDQLRIEAFTGRDTEARVFGVATMPVAAPGRQTSTGPAPATGVSFLRMHLVSTRFPATVVLHQVRVRTP